VTILVCQCGARLNAPGATPGRSGKCPACGSVLRVPDAAIDSPVEDPHDQTPTSHGLEIAPHAVQVRLRARRRRKPSKPSFLDKLEAWQGLVRRPNKPEARIWESLLYPCWDIDGLVFLVIFSIIWWALMFVPFSLALDGATLNNPILTLVAPVLLLGPVLVFGYTLLYLGEVLITSVAGEVRHPRWSAIDPYGIMRGIWRWFWAFLIGGVLGLFPAVWYWIRCGKVDMLDWVVLVDLIVPGVAYGQMALVASLLFDDPLGANPITVGQALWRVGLRSLRSALVVSAAVMLTGGLWVLLVAIPIPALAYFLFWIFLIFILYEALVVMRILGLEYRREARKIGWFRDSRRRSG
jgi:hypothetical protein